MCMWHGNIKIQYYLCNYVWYKPPSWMQKIKMYNTCFTLNLKVTSYIHIYDMKRFNEQMCLVWKISLVLSPDDTEVTWWCSIRLPPFEFPVCAINGCCNVPFHKFWQHPCRIEIKFELCTIYLHIPGKPTWMVQYITELLDSTCRDSADMQHVPYPIRQCDIAWVECLSL